MSSAAQPTAMACSRGAPPARAARTASRGRRRLPPASRRWAPTCGMATGRHPFGTKVHRDAEFLQEVGRSAGRARRPVAVLHHPPARPCHDEGGHGRDVDRVRAVTASPAVSSAGAGTSIVMPAESMARPGRSPRWRTRPGSQRNHEAGELGRSRLAGHDLRHRPGGSVAREVWAGQEVGQNRRPARDGRQVGHVALPGCEATVEWGDRCWGRCGGRRCGGEGAGGRWGKVVVWTVTCQVIAGSRVSRCRSKRETASATAIGSSG